MISPDRMDRAFTCTVPTGIRRIPAREPPDLPVRSRCAWNLCVQVQATGEGARMTGEAACLMLKQRMERFLRMRSIPCRARPRRMVVQPGFMREKICLQWMQLWLVHQQKLDSFRPVQSWRLILEILPPQVWLVNAREAGILLAPCRTGSPDASGTALF